MGLPPRASTGLPIQDQINALNARVESLASQVPLLAPNQKSPVPGEILASRITTSLPAGLPQMALDLIQTTPGNGPLLWVSDGTYRRVQLGNLADYVGPNGIDSPAQYGFRALDASGNNIFDSMGLIAVMTYLGSSSLNGGSQAGSGSGQELSDGQLNFTLSQKATVIAFALINLSNSIANQMTGVQLQLDHGAAPGLLGLGAASPNATTMTPSSLVSVSNGPLAAGAHSLNFLVTAANTDTYTWAGLVLGGIMAFQLGRSL